MCEYCEPSKHGLCKALATAKRGIEIPLVGLVKDENSGRLELNVNYDGEEPLRISANYCMVCGAKLNKKPQHDSDFSQLLAKELVDKYLSRDDDIEAPGYYKFLETRFGFKFDGCYYTKKFRDNCLFAQYYPHEHSYRIYSLKDDVVKDVVMKVPCYTKSDICYVLTHYYEDVLAPF